MHYEAIRAHSAVVTCSLFAPVPHLVLEAVERGKEAAGKEGTGKKEQQGQRSTRVSKNSRSQLFLSSVDKSQSQFSL